MLIPGLNGFMSFAGSSLKDVLAAVSEFATKTQKHLEKHYSVTVSRITADMLLTFGHVSKALQLTRLLVQC